MRLLRNLGETFEHDAYTPFALLSDLGVPDTAARVATIALGLALLALAWRRRSLGLAIAAALVLSPIVWRHFFTLLLVPLALSRPRFDVVWLIPIGMWVGDGTLNGAPWQTAAVLALAAATFALCERPPARARRGRRSPPTPCTRSPCTRLPPTALLPVLLLGVLPVVVVVAMFARRPRRQLARRSTSTTSCTRKRSCCSTGRTRSRARTPSSEFGHNLIWPPLAAFLVAPFTLLSPTGADWAIAICRPRRVHALAADRGRPRLARLRRVRALALGGRRDPRLAPDAVPLPAPRRRLALPRRALRAGARGRARGCDQVLPLAARRVARGDRAGARDARGSRRSPARRSCSSCRSRASTTTSAPCSSSGGRSTRTATRRSASSPRSARRRAWPGS